MAASLVGLAWKHMIHKKWKTFFLAVSISLSVGLLCTVILIKEQMNQGLEELRVGTFGEADLWIGTRENPDTENGAGIDSKTVAKIKQSNEVSELGAILDGSRYWSEMRHKIHSGFGAFMAGVDNHELTKSYFLFSEDLGENEFALSEPLAEQLHVRVNDTLSLPMPDGTEINWAVREILKPSRANESAAFIALFHLESFQRMMGMEGKVSSVLIRLQVGVNKEAAERLLRKELNLGSEYLFQPIETDDRLRLNTVPVQAIMYVLTGFAVFAAMVVVISILQTAFRERVVELATVRSIGGSARQLFILFLFEVGMIALVGVAIGMGGGIAVSQYASQAIAEVMKLQLVKASIPVGQLIFVSVSAFILILGASWPPLFKAADSDPMACFKQAYEEEPSDKPPLPSLIGMFAAGLLAWGGAYFLQEGTGLRLLLNLIGGVVLSISIIRLLRHGLKPCMMRLIPFLSRFLGNDARVALTYITVNQNRTTLTVLLISLSLIVFIPLSFLTAFSKQENEASIDRIYIQDADIIIENRHTGFYRPTLPFSLVEELESMEHVQSVIPMLPMISAKLIGYDFTKSDPAWLGHNDVSDAAMGTDTSRNYERISVYPTDLKKMVEAGAISDFSTDASRTAVLSKAYAGHLGVKMGETITVRNGDRTEDVVIGATVDRLPYFISDDRVMLVDMEHPILTKPDTVDRYFIRVSDPKNDDTVIAGIRLLQKRYPELRWREKQQEREELNTKTEQILGGLWITVYVMILTGFVGLFNLLSATIHEKRLEYGILRAIHFTPGQIVKNIMLQSAIYAVVSIVVGSLMGLIVIAAFFNGVGGRLSTVGLPLQEWVPFKEIGYMTGSLLVLTLLFALPMALRIANMKIVKLLARD